jgi:hypothetical protein
MSRDPPEKGREKNSRTFRIHLHLTTFAMSIRAYKIITLEYESSPAFNLTCDTEIMDVLSDSIYPQLNDDCGG